MIKKKLKELIVKRSVKKRKKNNNFDDLLSESFALDKNDGKEQNNSYYFSAHNQDGTSLFLRLGIRGGGEYEVWFGYYDKSGTAYVNSIQSFNEDNCPIQLKCITPLKEWEVVFDGFVKRAKCEDGSLILKPYGEEIKISFKGNFLCTEKLYEFSRDSDEINFARAVAREKWSKDFFKALSENTQVHTEQSGHLKGILTAESKEIQIDSPAMRDHSFGKREWDYMNRHIWLMAVSNEKSLNLSMVSYPALSSLSTGYCVSKGNLRNVIDASALNEIVKDGVLNEFSYSCKLKDGKIYQNCCKINAIFPFVMGGKYTIYEGIADYSLDSGRLNARGIAEFGYNLDEKRWKK